MAKKKAKTVKGHKQHKENVGVVTLGMSDDMKLRHQMYTQIFFVLDSDFDGTLDVEEISIFGKYAMGAGARLSPPNAAQNMSAPVPTWP